MEFHTYGNKENRSLLLIPGLGVSHEIFLPLIELLNDKFYIVAIGIDGFLLGHWTGFWKFVFHSHYIDVLLEECKKVWPYGKGKAVRNGYKDVYTNKLESIHGEDIHYWYGSKEAFVAKSQVKHLLNLCPKAQVEVFRGMNHGQLLVDRPEEVAKRIIKQTHTAKSQC